MEKVILMPDAGEWNKFVDENAGNIFDSDEAEQIYFWKKDFNKEEYEKQNKKTKKKKRTKPNAYVDDMSDDETKDKAAFEEARLKRDVIKNKKHVDYKLPSNFKELKESSKQIQTSVSKIGSMMEQIKNNKTDDGEGEGFKLFPSKYLHVTNKEQSKISMTPIDTENTVYQSFESKDKILLDKIGGGVKKVYVQKYPTPSESEKKLYFKQ